jgi:hypothetical protein
MRGGLRGEACIVFRKAHTSLAPTRSPCPQIEVARAEIDQETSIKIGRWAILYGGDLRFFAGPEEYSGRDAYDFIISP